MPATTLTPKQIWQKVAKAFEAYANGAPRTELTSAGLCYAVIQVASDYRVSDPLVGERYKYFNPRFDDPTASSFYWWKPRSRKAARERAVFATLMAEGA